MKQLQVKNNLLFFAGVDVCDIAQTYGTPVYVYDQNAIESNLCVVEDEFLRAYPNTRAYYAAKAFLTLKMADIIAKSRLGIDVASMGECYIAMQAGIEPKRILYHGNNKSYPELQYAIEHGVGRIVVDSLRELEDIATITTTLQQRIKILVRFSPKLSHIDTHKNIQTGHKTSKFGIDLDRHLGDIVQMIQKNEYMTFVGFHFHVGSQLKTNRHHIEAIEEIFPHMIRLKDEYGLLCKELDIGGGFGIAYTKLDTVLPLSDFVQSAMNNIQQYCEKNNIPMVQVAIEPGRSIVGPTAITIYKVGTVKETEHQSLIAIDGGMTDNLRVALYHATYEATIANKASEPHTIAYTVVGNACESTDVMIRDIELPLVEKGDILVVFNTGAYEHSLANNFNKMLRPAVVMIKDESVRVIQRKETLEDLIQRDF